MQINKEFLKSLKPCANRYENFLKHNASFDGSFSDFLDLTNLDYNDKIWVAVRVLTKNKRVKWAMLCVESVVHIFEAKYPYDRCLSNCIRYLKTVKDFNSLTDTEREEIERHLDIIQKALPAYAAYATSAAVRSATYTTSAATASHDAHATSAAVRSAAYATDAAFHAAKDAGEDANAAQENQEALNIQFLKQVTS